MGVDKQYEIEGVVLSIVSVFGIFSNAAAITYFGKHRLRKENFYGLILALSITDLLFNISCLCVFSVPAFSDCKEDTESYCHIPEIFWKCLVWLIPLSNVLRTGNIYFTLALTIERYFAICKPFLFHAKKLSYKLVTVGVIIFSIAFNIPKFLEYQWKIEQENVNGTIISQYGISATDMRNNWYYATAYILWCDILFLGFVPFFSLIYLNTLVIKEMSNFQSKVAMICGNTRKRLAQNRYVQVLMAKFNIFIV